MANPAIIQATRLRSAPRSLIKSSDQGYNANDVRRVYDGASNLSGSYVGV